MQVLFAKLLWLMVCLCMQDEFLDIRGAVDFLDSKRTCMQLASIEGITPPFN
jgi:hypothetical protein